MNISEKGLNLIKEFEGCRLSAYRDSVGVVTIGWGTTNSDYDITHTQIYMGMTISQATADSWLEQSVNKKYVPKVMKYDSIYHWNQNQLDSLTSFAYNIGSIDQLTANGTRSIAEISNKILAYDKAGGQTLAGLTRRRKAEKELFDTPVGESYGWIQDNKGWWYKNKDGSYPKNGWKIIDGKWYCFDKNGYLRTDEYIKSFDYDSNKKLYYVYKSGEWDGKSYKWYKDDNGWWFGDLNGGSTWFAKNEWAFIEGKWYFFDKNSYMIAGKTVTINGKKYTFNADGSLK